MPKIAGKNDPFAALKREAEEQGITLTKAADGSFTASAADHDTLEEYADPRTLLDDMVAIIAMDNSDDLFTYSANEFEEAVVHVNGGESFTAATFAKAYAQAQESVIAKAKPVEETGTEKAKRYKAESKARGPTQDIVSEPRAEAEIIPPAKPNGPNGMSQDNVDISGVLAEACLDMARTLTELAGKLSSGDALLPFRGEGYTEEETPAPMSPRTTAPKTSGRSARGK